MRKVLYVLVPLMAIILVSCTLAPFAFLLDGNQRPTKPTNTDGYLILDLSRLFENFSEDEKVEIATLNVEIKGNNYLNTFELAVDSDEKTVKLKPGSYTVKIDVKDVYDKVIGRYRGSVAIESSTKEVVSPTVKRTGTVSLTLPFPDESESITPRGTNPARDAYTVLIKDGSSTGGLLEKRVINKSGSSEKESFTL